MSGSTRGMIKWAPYKSLTEQEDFLRNMMREKNKVPHPHISKEKAEYINQFLLNYVGDLVRVEFFDDGFLYYIEDKIEFISSKEKHIEIQEKSINFKDIINIEYL